MIVDTNNYNILLGLDFFIKIGAMVDVGKGLIQVRQGLRNSVQVLPLNMVNMLHLIKDMNHCRNLSLRLAPRQGLVRLRAKRKLGSEGKCEGMNPHTPKRASTLGI